MAIHLKDERPLKYQFDDDMPVDLSVGNSVSVCRFNLPP